MKVFELMTFLATRPAGATIYVAGSRSQQLTELEITEDDGDDISLYGMDDDETPEGG